MIRKPHNLVTGYWDDIVFFYDYSEVIQKLIKNRSADLPELQDEKRGYRYCILSSFLFLEAFINSEFLASLHPETQIAKLNQVQIAILDKQIIETSFDDKWSHWIKLFANNKSLSPKGELFFQELSKLKQWRNHLTHYKIHHLMFVAHELETFENAKESVRIVRQTIKWYYSTTNFDIPEWIIRDILT